MTNTSTFPWNHQRCFNAFTNYILNKFGTRVQKLSVNAGFTCPNRDGNLSFKACFYCNNEAFNPSYCDSSKSIAKQIEEGIEFHNNRYRRSEKYLVYFQAYSNTYAPLIVLKEKFQEALAHPAVIGLSIGTRPDCLSEEVLDYLKELAREKYISIEIGVESCYDATLLRINRGHTFSQTKDAIINTAKRGLHVGIHLILGLPGESRDQMIDSASIISDLPVNSIKMHQLQIIKGTEFEKQYYHSPNDFQIFSLEEYIDLVIDFSEHLNPKIMIERFTAEVPPRFLVTGGFGLLRTDQILQKIEKRFEERNTWQGKLSNFKP